jgi:hypothetical protein
MPALTMPSDSAVTRYRMSGEPRRALQDTGTASVRNARQLSRAAVHMSAPRTAVHMSVPPTPVYMSVPPTPVHMNVPPTPVHMSVPRTAVKMSVPATPVKMSVSRTAAHMSATARVTTATIATIIAASTSSPSSERSTRRDEAGRMSCHCMRSKSVRVLRPVEVQTATRRESTSGSRRSAALSEWALPRGSPPVLQTSPSRGRPWLRPAARASLPGQSRGS